MGKYSGSVQWLLWLKMLNNRPTIGSRQFDYQPLQSNMYVACHLLRAGGVLHGSFITWPLALLLDLS